MTSLVHPTMQLLLSCADCPTYVLSPALPAAGHAAFAGTLDYDLPPPGAQSAMASTARLSGSTLRQLAGEGGGQPRGAAATSVLPPSTAAGQAAHMRAQGGGAVRSQAGPQAKRWAEDGAGAAAVSGPEAPEGDHPGAAGGGVEAGPQYVYRKGDLAWYLQRSGAWVPTQVTWAGVEPWLVGRAVVPLRVLFFLGFATSSGLALRF